MLMPIPRNQGQAQALIVTGVTVALIGFAFYLAYSR